MSKMRDLLSKLKDFDIQNGTLIRYKGTGGNVVVPAGVKSIAENAFINYVPLTSIMLPDGLESIGNGAFKNCKSLTGITMPNGVKSIAEKAFDGCEGLTSVTLPDGLESIGNGAFKNCKSLTGITMPNGVKSIAENVFDSCESLTSVALPDGLESIGNGAFKNCKSLSRITVPDGVSTIGEDAFRGCYELTSVEIPESVTTIGNGAFAYCRILTEVALPKRLKSIGKETFRGCHALNNIEVPDGVEYVGDIKGFFIGDYATLDGELTKYALYAKGYEAAKELIIKPGVTSIGKEAFLFCRDLISVDIPGSVTSIGNGAFSECSGLERVTLHKGLKSIGVRAFDGCVSLTDIVLPEGLETIGDLAFDSCWGLTSIEIPESVKSIGDLAFCNCKNLTVGALPEGLEKIGKSVFSGCKKRVDSKKAMDATGDAKRWPRISLKGLHNQIVECLPPQPAVKLTVKKGKVGLFDSKLGGTPYFPRDMEFPRGRANGFEGQPLTLLAQLNFDTLPHIPDFPTKGILQFFIAKDGRFGVGGYHGEEQTRQDNFRVIYHENVITDETKLLSADEIPQYVGDEEKNLLPVKGEYRLVAKKPADMAVTSSDHRFEKEILRICEEVYGKKLENVFELDDAFDCEDLGERLFEKADGYEGTFIGGYPCLIQDDPRESDCADCDTLLLEIWDQDDPEICWGFPGTGSFFIPRKNLKALDFSRVLYNVDCD